MTRIEEYNKDYIQQLFDTCRNRCEVLEKLGMCTSGNSYTTLYNYVKKYNIDTSRIESLRKKGSNRRLPHLNSEIKMRLELEGKTNNYRGHSLKNYIIRNNIKRWKCECCGRTKWKGENIPLQLHHIDGDHYNNNINNLQLLCPNCHAMTDNYGKKNKRAKNIIKK